MERIAFLIEETNQRVPCMLNPETLVLRRTAGLRARESIGGQITGAGRHDTPLIYTGGGRTVLELDLLFDVTIPGAAMATGDRSRDVRTLTRPFWTMAENTARRRGYSHPPQVRFFWGKAWNIPGVVEAVAERFEHFTREGVAQRSWLRLRMVRVDDPTPQPANPPGYRLDDLPAPETLPPPEDDWDAHQFTGGAEGERLDQLAARYYGNPSLWRLLATANGIDDPNDISAGAVLRVPRPGPLGDNRP